MASYKKDSLNEIVIDYFKDYISPSMYKYIKKSCIQIDGVPHLMQVDSWDSDADGLETNESLKFLCDLYDLVKIELNSVLNQRKIDREFIDKKTKSFANFNSLFRNFQSSDYKTILGCQDSNGRIVVGPKDEFFCKGRTKQSNEFSINVPDFLQGDHVTLFGPPYSPKFSINAMNSYHRKLKDEPVIIEKLLEMHKSVPKWGADNEDSCTPLRADLISSGVNLTECLDGHISYHDTKTGKIYKLENSHLAIPIKRFVGLALPSLFLFYKDQPVPLHLYDFALHLYKNWHNPKGLVFYVPKLENEEEAKYIRIMIEHAEYLIKQIHPSYAIGTVRLMIVIENPRAVFRVNEIIDELKPYFVGASLGWHDFLASTARIFKEDANYRIPVKADPNIVIKYIKASHDLLATVVGSHGGIKIGGMYGVLPISKDLTSPSFQITLRGYIKDVLTQLKRDLTGFWVAHPDFVRIGLALVEAWHHFKKGNSLWIETLVKDLLSEKYHAEILSFISAPDIDGLSLDDPLYVRSLIVADVNESRFIANNHPNEIRYNVFQSLQYLADWLSGNGCVALPAFIDGIPVRVMDDLATAERSRWEVWHEIRFKRFDLNKFLKIVHEELHYIRKGLCFNEKIVQVKMTEKTHKWYPIAMKIMIILMTNENPVEFATELLLPFTLESIRVENDPWEAIKTIDPIKYRLDPYVERFNYYFQICGNLKFAKLMSKNLVQDYSEAETCILSFDKHDLLDSVYYHGDIGENNIMSLDSLALTEHPLTLDEDSSIIEEIRQLEKNYSDKFGMKYLVMAKGKTISQILENLKKRLKNDHDKELEICKNELWRITYKRMTDNPLNTINFNLNSLLNKYNITGAQISISTGENQIQTIFLGEAIKNKELVTKKTWFQMASLSKTIGGCFAIEYFAKKDISLRTSVNALFEKTTSKFRLVSDDSSWAYQVTLEHLLSHTALNMHYVKGVPANIETPTLSSFLNGIKVINYPGKKFQYSGAGFIVLEHLIEALELKSIKELTRGFLDELGMDEFSFEQKKLSNIQYAHGYNDLGEEILDARKAFPSFAAGASGTSKDLAIFLQHLTNAFHSINGSGPISHDTAVLMLNGIDKGSISFMGTKMGLGLFTIEAGHDKFAIHQGANDGFRSIYIHCYDGPSQGMGFSIFSNSELCGVLFNCEVAQIILKELKFEGIDFEKFKSNFNIKNIAQEEIVNVGYKSLIFEAFKPNLPEKMSDIFKWRELDPLAEYNLAVDAKTIFVTNQKFGLAENLLSKYLPKFDPTLYGSQGKIMDSWETARHNQNECDVFEFELRKKSKILYVRISTKYHQGNHAQFVRIEGFDTYSHEWVEIISKIGLNGHSVTNILSLNPRLIFNKIKVSLYPDGGLTRLGLYSDSLPDEEKKKFKQIDEASRILYDDEVPKTFKSLISTYKPSEDEIQKNLATLKPGDEFDVASMAFGGKILSTSNEFYGPTIQVISPFSPIGMFDGFESARGRDSHTHKEVIIIQLAKYARICRIEIDFTYFIHNNPVEVEMHGLSNNKWSTLVSKTNVKAFAGNIKDFKCTNARLIEQVKILLYPDGGFNRVKIFSKCN